MSNIIYVYINILQENILNYWLYGLNKIIDDLHSKHKIKILYNDKLLNDQN